MYGSTFAEGLLSSRYPYPFLWTGKGILMEAPRSATPALHNTHLWSNRAEQYQVLLVMCTAPGPPGQAAADNREGNLYTAMHQIHSSLCVVSILP